MYAATMAAEPREAIGDEGPSDVVEEGSVEPGVKFAEETYGENGTLEKETAEAGVGLARKVPSC